MPHSEREVFEYFCSDPDTLAEVAFYTKESGARAYQAGANHATVRRVEEATSFWRNLPGNIAVGLASSFAFALLLVAASMIFDKDPSPIALYHRLLPHVGPPASPK